MATTAFPDLGGFGAMGVSGLVFDTSAPTFQGYNMGASVFDNMNIINEDGSLNFGSIEFPFDNCLSPPTNLFSNLGSTDIISNNKIKPSNCKEKSMTRKKKKKSPINDSSAPTSAPVPASEHLPYTKSKINDGGNNQNEILFNSDSFIKPETISLNEDEGNISRRLSSSSSSISDVTLTSPLQVYGLPLENLSMNSDSITEGLKASFIPYPQLTPTKVKNMKQSLKFSTVTPKKSHKSPHLQNNSSFTESTFTDDLLKTPALSPTQSYIPGYFLSSSSPLSGPCTPDTNSLTGNLDLTNMFVNPAMWICPTFMTTDNVNMDNINLNLSEKNNFQGQELINDLFINPFLVNQGVETMGISPTDLNSNSNSTSNTSNDLDLNSIMFSPDLLKSPLDSSISVNNDEAEKHLNRLLFGDKLENSQLELINETVDSISKQNDNKLKRSRCLDDEDEDYQDDEDEDYQDDDEEEYKLKRHSLNDRSHSQRSIKRIKLSSNNNNSNSKFPLVPLPPPKLLCSTWTSTDSNSIGSKIQVPLPLLCALYEPVDITEAGGTGGNYRCLFPGCLNSLQPTKTSMHGHITTTHDVDSLTEIEKENLMKKSFNREISLNDKEFLSPRSGKRLNLNSKRKVSGDAVITTTTTGTRIFRCKTCHMPFIRNHDLRRHERVHSGSREFVCPCGKGFARGDALGRHRQRGICEGSTVPLRKGFEHLRQLIK